MKPLLSALAVAAAILTTPVMAQETGTTAEGLSLGETIVNGRAIGEEYIAATFDDWAHRCVTTEDGDDPCNAYQLLLDNEGNSVAEISLVPLAAQGQAVAGGTIVTPLETLLMRQISLQIDSGAVRRYPFTFCTRSGCISRVGFTTDDVAAMKAGSGATITIVPAGSPDTPVVLEMSLTGFTAAYDALEPR
ncbi:MAG: invasion associated locus B family protein [Pseudomonadota bacterium]